MNKQYKDKLARDVYLENRSVAKGVDMIKENHVKTKDVTSDMKLFKETKGECVISTFCDRIEIMIGAQLEIIYL